VQQQPEATELPKRLYLLLVSFPPPNIRNS
jgi:hypothetical protein